WKDALSVFHRESVLREQLSAASRQHAMVEMEARFDDVRKTREIEILKRDNALQRANLTTQKYRQNMTMLGIVVIVMICVALVWAFTRVRKVSGQLRHASEHDALTGLHNRRYFNDKLLLPQESRRFDGCVILIDVDHFKRINDALGHPTG